MLKWIENINFGDKLPLQDIPPQFLMTKQEMLDEAAMEFIEGNLSWDELYDEHRIIEDMFKDE